MILPWKVTCSQALGLVCRHLWWPLFYLLLYFIPMHTSYPCFSSLPIHSHLYSLSNPLNSWSTGQFSRLIILLIYALNIHIYSNSLPKCFFKTKIVSSLRILLLAVKFYIFDFTSENFPIVPITEGILPVEKCQFRFLKKKFCESLVMWFWGTARN